jgi:two-component system, chemotaxis family, CheB/CheR fusion protein
MSDADIEQGLEELLIYLKQNRSFDFTGYKRSSLMRRFQRRMAAVEVDSFEAYQDYLEVHPREFGILFNTILINFTGFFRDADAWQHIHERIIPSILKSVPHNAPIRVWSAGCASGEEAYTLAILFAEALGVDDFRRRLKIYATDVDEHALAQARQGVYSERAIQGVPVEWRERYFEPLDDQYIFRKDLRRILVFGRHDLMRDAPISRLDLLVCRNTLIYFNRLSQKRIIANFHFAIKETGFLFLGRAEMLLAQDNLFEAASINHRIFTKIADVRLRDKLLMASQDANPQPSVSQATSRLWEMAFYASPVAQVIVDPHGSVALTNERAQQLFGLQPSDIGQPFRDLELSYRPVELRSLIDRAQSAQTVIRLEDVERVLPSGQAQYFDIEVAALALTEGMRIGTQLSFMDVTSRQLLRRALEKARQDVQTSNEELQATNEELETANEELQSTVEELQTTNEELQSTNEEMETVNEELQSTNHELQAVNEELRQQTFEADRTSLFLESILASVEVGVVVIDRDYRIMLWNEQAEELWGLRSGEVCGRSLLNLDTGLPVDQLVKPLQRRWNDSEGNQHEITLNAVNRRGRPIRVRVTMTLRDTQDPHFQSVVLVMNKEVQP